MTVLVAAALVVEPASRSAGKLNTAAINNSPRRRPGAFQGAGSRKSLTHFNVPGGCHIPSPGGKIDGEVVFGQ